MNGNKRQPTKTQAKTFRRRVRVALAQNDLTVNTLAQKVGKPRTSVSKAINQGVFPKIQAKIAKALSL